MKRKNLLLLMALIPALASCNNNNSSSSNPDDEFQLQYDVVDGEVVIDDKVLTSSTEIASNNNNRVFYEIFTGSFSDSNGDGIGDLQGIINRLDYLNDGKINSGRSLGVQGIWLTPIFKSPTYHKYDVTDYYTIDPAFGDMETLKKLVDECHKRNIKLIIDLPINHTGYHNEWFAKFRQAHANNDTENPYYDYYTYYKKGETAPSGRVFRIVTGTDTYYESNFSQDMPELNFDNASVREQVLEIAKYYLDLGIDGFRFDAAKYVYLNDDEKSSEFWGWYVSELKKIKPDIYTVGEVWDADSVIEKYQKQGLGCFNFSTSGAEGKIASTAQNASDVYVYTSYYKSYYDKIKAYGDDARMYSFITNHDMDRTAGFLPLLTRVAYMGANIQLLSPGSPFIYYGDEIGMKGSRGGANTDADRRLKMRWGDGDTIKDPSEASFEESKQTNGTVSSHIGSEGSLLTHYKKLIMIRNAFPEIYSGTFESLKYNKEFSSVGGFLYTLNGSKVCVIHNTSKMNTVTIDISTLTSTQLKAVQVYIGAGKASLEGNMLTIDKLTTVVLK